MRNPSIPSRLTRSGIIVVGFVTTNSSLIVSAFSPNLWTALSLHQSTAGSYSNSFLTPQQARTYITTACWGIDFDALNEFEDDCDFLDGDLSQMDLTICLPAPSASLPPDDAVRLCLDALSVNNEPKDDAGLEVCWNFSSDNCRAAIGGSLEEFIQFANNPVFQSMVDAQEWKTISIGPEIAGTQHRGAMQTFLVEVITTESAKKIRRFLWTMMKERRPPRQGCWLVHECIAVDKAHQLTV